MTALTPDMPSGRTTHDYRVAWRKQRLAAGLCMMCAGPSRQKPDGTYKYLCQSCADREVARHRMNYVPRRGYQQKPTAATLPRTGTTWCLRCDGLFPSPDVVKVRICGTCRPSQEVMIEKGLDADGWAVEAT